MTSKEKNIVSEELEDLIKDSPSSIMKLLATWDDLSIETQIKILYSFKNRIPDKLKSVGLSSPNPYIRYLISRKGWFDRNNKDDKEFLDKIENDTFALVKYSSNYGSINSETFIALSQSERLACIYHRRFGYREIPRVSEFIEAISLGIDSKKIDKVCAYELIKEYIQVIEKLYTDEDAEAFWDLAVKLKETWGAPIIFDFLADECNHRYGLPESIEQRILDFEAEDYPIGMGLLEYKLYEDDFFQSDLRKKILFTKGKDGDRFRQLKRAAASVNFEITVKELDDIIERNDKDTIIALVDYQVKLPPLYLHALQDLRETFPEKKSQSDDYLYKRGEDELIKEFFEEKNKGWSDKSKINDIKCELSRLAVYFLACRCIPIKSADEEETENDAYNEKKINIDEILGKDFLFLKEKIISNDRWKTYLSFTNALGYRVSSNKLLKEIDEYTLSHLGVTPLEPDRLFSDNGKGLIDEKMNVLYNEIKKINNLIENTKSGINGLIAITPYFLAFVLIIYFIKEIFSFFSGN